MPPVCPQPSVFGASAFGASGFSTFSFGGATEKKEGEEDGEEGGEADPEAECKAEFKPVVQLEEVETSTGEEDEATLLEQ